MDLLTYLLSYSERLARPSFIWELAVKTEVSISVSV